MKIVRIFLTAFARFCISLVFLAGALNKIFHWHESERSLHAILCEWQSNIGYIDSAHECFAIFIPITPILLLVATLMELFGALLVLLGIKEKFGAFLLIAFLIPVTLIMHQFWFVEGMMREQQLAHFFKNLAILGGLLIIMLHGTAASPATRQFPRL